MDPLKRHIGQTAFHAQNLVVTSDDATHVDLRELKQLVKKFAPIICFHPAEEFMPVSVDWYLQKVSLVNSQKKTRIPAYDHLLTETRGNAGKYYLEPESGVSMFGSESQIKAYVHAKARNAVYIDLQYWFLFAETDRGGAQLKWLIDGIIKGYEGKIDLDPLGRINGVWERITVRINKISGEAEEVFFPQSDKGTWVPFDKVQKKGRQVVAYLSADNCTFYPGVGTFLSEEASFDLYSSRLDFSIQHESGKGREVNFSPFCELVSANYLEENKPVEPFWLNFKYNWGNPDPDYLNVSSLKRLVPTMFDKSVEFLVSKDLLNNLVNHLLVHFREECRHKSFPPKFRPCWFGEEQN